MPEHVFISQVIDLNFTYRYTNIFTLSCVLAFKEVWAGSNYKNSLIQNIFLKCSILFMDFKGIALGQIVFVWQAPDHAKWQSIFLKWKKNLNAKTWDYPGNTFTGSTMMTDCLVVSKVYTI